jgi:hypothetical protein
MGIQNLTQNEPLIEGSGIKNNTNNLIVKI